MKLYWDKNLARSLQDADSFESISNIFSKTAWDPLHLLYAYVEIQDSKQYSPEDKDEFQRRFMILVSYFTDSFFPPIADVRAGRVPPAGKYGVYQFYRSVIRQDPLSVSGLTNARRIESPQPCGKTTKHTSIQKLSSARYETTNVHVISGDTVDVASSVVPSAVAKGKRVAVLNMTHPRRPGGSWKKGEISQEETLFLRTGLSRGLDSDDYPLETFTCLYTENVHAIRRGLEYGYSFLEGDGAVFDVVSMAGIDASTCGGKKKQNAFTGKEAATNRAKFELMFNACASKGAEVLILGAIGCGAFDNPPNAVAGAFRAVIDLYAGYFTDIYFVIYATNAANVFARELISRDCVCDKEKDTPETCPTRTYSRIFHELPQPTDLRLRICEEAGGCTSIDSDHYVNFMHPPFCPLANCPYFNNPTAEGAALHNFNFMHKTMCPLGGRCVKGADANDIIHSAHFTHPPRCPAWAECTNMSDEHMMCATHPPMCPKGLLCPDKENPAHKRMYRHAATQCPFGHQCRLILDSRHMETYSHPFLQPCELSPYECTDTSRAHMERRSHLCKNGPNCPEINNADHAQHFYHAGIACKHKSSCTNFSEEHLQTFWHPSPSTTGSRKICRTQWCTDMSPQHRREFYHLPTRMALSPVDMLNCRDPGNQEAYGDFSKTECARVPFFSNMTRWLDKLNSYLGSNLSTDSQNFKEIKAWFENIRPMHMCSADVAISMCKIGAMLSAKKIQALWESRKDVVDCAFNRETMREIVGEDAERKKRIKKYSAKYVRMRQGIISQAKLPELMKKIDVNSRAVSIYQKTGLIGSDKESERQQDRSACVSVYGEDLVRRVESELDDIVDAISKIIDNAPGINHESDEIMRTNHIVFSIIGPHYYNYGKTEVVFVLRKTIMWHPDFYMTPGAATSYRTARYHMGREPWMGESKAADGGAMDDYFLEKFSLIDPRWSEAAAKDFICRTLNVEFKKPVTEASTVTLSMLRQYWSNVNPHAVIEGHLPSLVPMDYVEHVILQRGAYNKIMQDPIAKAQFDAWTRRYGSEFVQVVNTPEEVRSSNDDYLLRTRPLYVPTGYSFAVYGKREQFMPIKFKQDEGKIFIYFSVCGGMFSISVSNIGDLTAKGIKREVATFTVNGSMKGVSAYFLPPLATINAKKAGEALDFNAGCPTSKFINYVLCVDHTTGTLTFKHWGSSTLFNNKEFKINFDKRIRYSHLSFSSTAEIEEPPRVWNLSIEYEERRIKIPTPLPTETEIQNKTKSTASPSPLPNTSGWQQQQQQQQQSGPGMQAPVQQQPAWGNPNIAWGSQQQQSTPAWGQSNQNTWGGGWN